MLEQTVLVWDLETVPDLTAAARMLGLETAPEADVRDALGPGFPKHPLHKIVLHRCLSCKPSARRLAC
jgi:3'-5' exonuclease